MTQFAVNQLIAQLYSVKKVRKTTRFGAEPLIRLALELSLTHLPGK